MKLAFLCDVPHCIHTLAQWHHTQWAHLNPGDSWQARAERLRQHGKVGMPVTLVAMDESGQPLGSAALIECDMHTHRELSPWLASVYVETSQRNRGTGSQLVNAISDHAAELGFNRMYLFTPDRAPFYEKLGWSTMFVEPFSGIEATVMQRPLPRMV